LMFDVVEHLPKDRAKDILRSAKSAMVLVPLEGEVDNNAGLGEEGSPHVSAWTADDFTELGYKTSVLKDFHNIGGKYRDALWAEKSCAGGD